MLFLRFFFLSFSHSLFLPFGAGWKDESRRDRYRRCIEIESEQTKGGFCEGGERTRGSENGFAVPRPKIIPWLASSIRVCLGLKGQQVILRRLERIYRGRGGEGKQPKICFSDWTCGGCAKGTATGRERGERSRSLEIWERRVKRLSTPERSKSKERS